MNLKEAMEIVYELAEQNALDEHEAGEMGQQDEFAKQQLAMDTVHDFIVNVISEQPKGLNMRTTEIKLTEDRITPEAERAIQRLTTWALTEYDTLKICPDGLNDLIAYYDDTATGRKYTIGAIWNEKEKQFTFHS